MDVSLNINTFIEIIFKVEKEKLEYFIMSINQYEWLM
jgi:hypothetical protein